MFVRPAVFIVAVILQELVQKKKIYSLGMSYCGYVSK